MQRRDKRKSLIKIERQAGGKKIYHKRLSMWTNTEYQK